MTLTRTPLALLSVLAAGCIGPARLESFEPVLRARAIKRVAIADDIRQVPSLVNRLEDEDPAVRFYAVLALRRLTGDDFGFDYTLEPARQPNAVQRWRDYAASRLGGYGGPLGPAAGATVPPDAAAESTGTEGR